MWLMSAVLTLYVGKLQIETRVICIKADECPVYFQEERVFRPKLLLCKCYDRGFPFLCHKPHEVDPQRRTIIEQIGICHFRLMLSLTFLAHGLGLVLGVFQVLLDIALAILELFSGLRQGY